MSEVGGTIHVPFPAKSTESTLLACNELVQLGISQIALTWDCKSKHGQQIADEVARELGSLVSPLEVDTAETALAWRLGIIAAYESSPNTRAVFVFPGDLDPLKIDLDDLRPKLGAMLALATEKRLVLGDYDSPLTGQTGKYERFKTDFDTLMTIPTVKSVFPHLLDEVQALRQSK